MSSSVAAVPNPNNSSLYIIPVTIVLPIALALCILRIWTRITRTKRLYFDDWLILVAEPLSVINAICAYTAIGYGWGRPLATLTPEHYKMTMQLQFAVQTTWIFTLCFVRLSVACSLLRFGTDLWWKWMLYVLMGLQICISSSYVVIQFAQCRPLSWSWAMVPDVKCWDINAIINYGWAVAAIYVTMDLILSLMPIKLIMHLHRSRTERILIGCLMALGLIATGVAAGKMTTFNSFGSGDPMQATIKPSMFAKLEEVVGIIASCLPALKQPVEKILRRFGLLKEHEMTRPSFVNDVDLPDMQPVEKDQRSSGEGTSPFPSPVKNDLRIDSHSVKPGTANSEANNGKRERTETWEVV